ncbi:MAG: hypothetical protein AAFS10_04535, partial [Myxococcota bacterium]
MTQSTLMCLVSLLWTSLAVGCAMAPQALPVAHRAALQSAESAPDTCGELVYEGKVYDADDEGVHGEASRNLITCVSFTFWWHEILCLPRP